MKRVSPTCLLALVVSVVFLSARAESESPLGNPAPAKTEQDQADKQSNAQSNTQKHNNPTEQTAPVEGQASPIPPTQGGTRITHNHPYAKEPIKDWIFWVSFGAPVLFNLLLVGFTWGLLQTSKRQWKATKQAADAATKSAEDATRTAGAAIASNQLSQKNFIAEYRPWISVDIGVSSGVLSGLTWEGNLAHLELAFTLKNHGRTPAFDVYVYWGFATEKSDDETMTPRARQRAVCETKNKLSLHGLTIFPGEISKPITLRVRQSIRPYNPFRLLVVGCVDYRTVLEPNHYETGFMVRVAVSHPDNPPDLVFLYSTHGQNVPANSLRLVPCYHHGGYYAT